jgi:hypothetical protein
MCLVVGALKIDDYTIAWTDEDFGGFELKLGFAVL